MELNAADAPWAIAAPEWPDKVPKTMLSRIGVYEIQAELGRGAFTRVYRASDPSHSRPVAIKVPAEEGEAGLFAPLHKEAAELARSGHRNVVTVYQWGEHAGLPFIVVEHLQGNNLRQAIANRRPLTLLQKMLIMSQVADALRWAHHSGAIHLDIKPCNIMLLANGSVKLMDFGAVELNEETLARLSRQGYLHANALYAAPEQFEGSETGRLGDIFSYGVLYYELLSGQNPFEAPDIEAVMRRVVGEKPAPLRSLVADCPEGLERIVHRALEKDPALRYQSLEELQSDVLTVLPSRPAPPVEASPRREPIRRPAPVAMAGPTGSARWRRLAFIGAPVLFVFAGTGMLGWKSLRPSSVGPTPSVVSAAPPVPAEPIPVARVTAPPPPRSVSTAGVPTPQRASVGETPEAPQEEVSAPAEPARPQFDVSVLQRPASQRALALADNPPAATLAQTAIPTGAQGSAIGRILTTTAVAPPPAPPPSAPPPAEAPRVARATRELVEPKLIGGPQPLLPRTARERGIYGAVNLEATVGKDGRVKDVKVLSGHPFLVQAAREAVLGRRYQPGRLNGQPIEVVVPMQIVFQQSQ